MNGYGIFYWPDKKKYYGHYVNNNKDGFGRFVWIDGKVFEGMWKNGKQHGVGMLTNKECVIYGEWYQGKKLKEMNDISDQIETSRVIQEKKKEKEYIEFESKIECYESKL